MVNNGRSRIDLLLSGKKEDGDSAPRVLTNETNEVPSDRRMRLVSLPVNKDVGSLQAGDFNGDGKPDLAFYGTPAELVILFNQGKGRFGDPKRINTGEAVESGERPDRRRPRPRRPRRPGAAGGERGGGHLPGRGGEARRAGPAAAHRGQPPDRQGGRPRRQRRRRPADPRRGLRRPDPRPVRRRRRQARPRAALLRRDAQGDRLRPGRRQGGLGAADDRGPVGPRQGADARRRRGGRAGQARPADLLPAAAGDRAGALAGPGRPRRRRPSATSW